MTNEEIRETWEDFYGNEAFEIFDHEQIDNATVEQALGPEVATEYASWVYCNLK